MKLTIMSWCNSFLAYGAMYCVWKRELRGSGTVFIKKYRQCEWSCWNTSGEENSTSSCCWIWTPEDNWSSCSCKWFFGFSFIICCQIDKIIRLNFFFFLVVISQTLMWSKFCCSCFSELCEFLPRLIQFQKNDEEKFFSWGHFIHCHCNHTIMPKKALPLVHFVHCHCDHTIMAKKALPLVHLCFFYYDLLLEIYLCITTSSAIGPQCFCIDLNTKVSHTKQEREKKFPKFLILLINF